MRDTQRGSQLHGEEKREEGDRGDQDEMRWNQKGESKLTSNHFLMCAPQSGPLRDVHRVIQRREEKRKEGDRGGQEDNGGNQKERDRSSQ